MKKKTKEKHRQRNTAQSLIQKSKRIKGKENCYIKGILLRKRERDKENQWKRRNRDRKTKQTLIQLSKRIKGKKNNYIKKETGMEREKEREREIDR